MNITNLYARNWNNFFEKKKNSKYGILNHLFFGLIFFFRKLAIAKFFFVSQPWWLTFILRSPTIKNLTLSDLPSVSPTNQLIYFSNMFPIVLCNTSSSEQSFCTGFGILRDHLNAVILKKTMLCSLAITIVEKNVL